MKLPFGWGQRSRTSGATTTRFSLGNSVSVVAAVVAAGAAGLQWYESHRQNVANDVARQENEAAKAAAVKDKQDAQATEKTAVADRGRLIAATEKFAEAAQDQATAARTQADASARVAAATASQAATATKALVDGNRAWLGMQLISLERLDEHRFRYRVRVTNTGRSPASNVIFTAGNTEMTGPPVDFTPGFWEPLCRKTDKGDLLHSGDDSGREFVEEIFVDGKVPVFAFVACATYKSMGTIHTTAICQYARRASPDTPLESAALPYCPSGNWAD